MRLGWNRPAAVVPLDPEQALDLTVYIRIYVRKRVRTHVSACSRSRTVLANERKRTRTQINAPLRLTRGRFLRANAFAFCALDLKLSGCTVCGSVWLWERESDSNIQQADPMSTQSHIHVHSNVSYPGALGSGTARI